MPTLKAIHICNSHQPSLKPKIAKEYVFANANRRTKKKYDCPTLYKRNAGFTAKLKVSSRNKILDNMKILSSKTRTTLILDRLGLEEV